MFVGFCGISGDLASPCPSVLEVTFKGLWMDTEQGNTEVNNILSDNCLVL